jgi:diadenosine tetraphosphate (Ap4A) HIT family hydrolase
VEGRRVAWDVDAYLDRVRAGCFVCGLLSGEPGCEHDVVHRDEVGVVFLARYPLVWGHVLVAPVAHREHVVDDVPLDDHLRVQALVHRAGRALTSVVPTERLYVLSLGSQQGNRHVHWHLVPLPPGVPYVEQQTALFDVRNGWREFPPGDLARLAASIAGAMGA